MSLPSLVSAWEEAGVRMLGKDCVRVGLAGVKTEEGTVAQDSHLGINSRGQPESRASRFNLF